MTDVNIALGKPAYMSSYEADIYKASLGNDGIDTTRFTTERASKSWWAVDFGEEKALVTGLLIKNSYESCMLTTFLYLY